jgi:hypothetical protein
MNRYTNLLLGLLVAACVAVAALQGVKVRHLRESDEFYKWLISASTQMRLEDRLIPPRARAENVEYMDEELFREVEAIAEDRLPDLEGGMEAGLPDEEPLSKLIKYAIAPEELYQLGDEYVGVRLPSEEEQKRRLAELWRFSRSGAVAEQRAKFLEYRGNEQLASIGSQFDLNQMYSENRDLAVSLSNVFFGMRKMAANLLWLRADTMWHEGAYYRMIPVMNTVVALDPQFVDAYLVGAWHLAYNATAKMKDTPLPLRRYDPRYGERVGEKEMFYQEGINFLEDGIQKNPTNYKLYFDLGFSIYYEKLEDYENAVRYLTEAHRQQHDVWVPRMLYLAMSRNGQYEEAIAGYEDYLEKHPEHEQSPRLIMQNRGLLEEQRAEEATARMDAALEQAEDLEQEAAAARADGQTRLADRLEDEAREQREIAEEAAEAATAHRVAAREFWEELRVGEDDPLAEAKLLQMEALDLVQEERYTEALAKLDYARWLSDELWFEISDLMIDIRLKQGSPLNLSERNALADRRMREAVEDRELAGRTFEFRDDGWYQEEYADQDLESLTPERAEDFGRAIEDFGDVMSLARLNEYYPEVSEEFGPQGLGDKVVFKHDDQWYVYRSS